jgi:hypothetical protein
MRYIFIKYLLISQNNNTRMKIITLIYKYSYDKFGYTTNTLQSIFLQIYTFYKPKLSSLNTTANYQITQLK